MSWFNTYSVGSPMNFAYANNVSLFSPYRRVMWRTTCFCVVRGLIAGMSSSSLGDCECVRGASSAPDSAREPSGIQRAFQRPEHRQSGQSDPPSGV